MSALVTLLGMCAVTYAARLAGLSLGHLRLSAFWLAFLRFVPISVFAALIVPDVVNSADWPRQVLACAVAALLFWRTKAIAWGILGGFAVYWLLRQVS